MSWQRKGLLHTIFCKQSVEGESTSTPNKQPSNILFQFVLRREREENVNIYTLSFRWTHDTAFILHFSPSTAPPHLHYVLQLCPTTVYYNQQHVDDIVFLCPILAHVYYNDSNSLRHQNHMTTIKMPLRMPNQSSLGVSGYQWQSSCVAAYAN